MPEEDNTALAAKKIDEEEMLWGKLHSLLQGLPNHTDIITTVHELIDLNIEIEELCNQ